MTLYINEIIGRLLQTQGFEQVLERDIHKSLPNPPAQSNPSNARRVMQSRLASEASGRRGTHSDIAVHKRIASEASNVPQSGLGSGISRAFSFRRKPDPTNVIPNLRPLKLVEEQNPGPSLRSDGVISQPRERRHVEGNEPDINEQRAKRASWVPGWFAMPGGPAVEEKQ
jgi:hypothetical protein